MTICHKTTQYTMGKYNRDELVEIIIKLRIDKGLSRRSIVEFLKEKYGYATSYAYELVREANKKLDEILIKNFGEDLLEDIERFERIYEAQMANKNYKDARETLKEIAKLKGHYKERIDLTTNGKDITPIINLNWVKGEDKDEH